jgi:hypothetical protein
MKKTFFLFMAAPLLLSSCATIFSKSSYPVTITSKPDSAYFTISNQKGENIYDGITPTQVKLKASSKAFVGELYNVRFSKDGYQNTSKQITTGTNPWFYASLVFCPYGGFLVDPLSGAMFRIKEDSINATLPKALPRDSMERAYQEMPVQNINNTQRHYYSNNTWNKFSLIIKYGFGGAGVSSTNKNVDGIFVSKIGIMAIIPLKNRWSLRPSLYYSEKGFEYCCNYYDEKYALDYYVEEFLDYLEMPIDVAFRLPLLKHSGLSVFAGPYLGYGLKGKARVECDYYNLNVFSNNHGGDSETFCGIFSHGSSLNENAKDENGKQMYAPKNHRFDFGLHSGVDYDFRHITFGFECTLGLTNLHRKTHDIVPLCGDHSKNRTLMFALGYKF